MSYTHTWRRPASIPDAVWVRIRNDMALTLQLFDASASDPGWREAGVEPVALRGPDGTGAPLVTPLLVAFNGDVRRRGAGQPFRFPRTAESPAASDGTVTYSCDTGLLPYGLTVCAVLLVAKYHLGPSLLLESDGGVNELAWPIAREVAGTVLGLRGSLARRTGEGIVWIVP